MTIVSSIHTATGERKYITVSERERFVAEAAKEDLPTYAFCLLLCLTGCRVSEALALHTVHVDPEEQVVRFRTLKRRKQVVWRSIPVPESLLRLLEMMAIEPGAPLFPFCRSTAWRRVSRIMRRAGICGAQATPKGLRHYFGVQADANGIPQPMLQRWMGHAKLESTAVYRQAVGAEERALAARLCWIG